MNFVSCSSSILKRLSGAPGAPRLRFGGETEEEARQNIEEAIRLYLAPAENRGNDWVSAVRLA
jgi:hypothetical protein